MLRNDLDRFNTRKIRKLNSSGFFFFFFFFVLFFKGNLYLRKGFSSVLRKHCNNDLIHDLKLRFVETRHLDEDIPCV